MFRVFPLPIIRSFLLYIRHWCIYCRFDDSFQAGSGWNIIKKKFVTMHGDMNVYLCVVMLNSDARRSQSQNPFSEGLSHKIHFQETILLKYDTVTLRSVGIRLPRDAASYPRRRKSSLVPLR